jgi:hypothetical protein
MKRPLQPLIPAIDVVSVDSNPAPTPSGTSSASRVRDVSVRWCVVAVALTLAAAMSMLLWWQHRSRVEFSVATLAAPQPANVDASGCPAGVTCESWAQAPNELVAAVLRVFPGSVVLESTSRVVSETQKVAYTSTVLQTANSVVVSISTQCVPGAGAVPERRGPLDSIGPADEVLVAPGRPGCSVVIVAHVPRAAPAPTRQLEQIARDPAIQLSP